MVNLDIHNLQPTIQCIAGVKIDILLHPPMVSKVGASMVHTLEVHHLQVVIQTYPNSRKEGHLLDLTEPLLLEVHFLLMDPVPHLLRGLMHLYPTQVDLSLRPMDLPKELIQDTHRGQGAIHPQLLKQEDQEAHPIISPLLAHQVVQHLIILHLRDLKAIHKLGRPQTCSLQLVERLL